MSFLQPSGLDTIADWEARWEECNYGTTRRETTGAVRTAAKPFVCSYLKVFWCTAEQSGRESDVLSLFHEVAKSYPFARSVRPLFREESGLVFLRKNQISNLKARVWATAHFSGGPRELNLANSFASGLAVEARIRAKYCYSVS